MPKRAITFEEIEHVAFAKSEVIDQKTSPPSAATAQYSLACWIYLAAGAITSLGWIWFLARIALRLLRTVWGFFENI
jgi:hypothetical protein